MMPDRAEVRERLRDNEIRRQIACRLDRLTAEDYALQDATIDAAFATLAEDQEEECICVGEREEAPPVPDRDCPVHGQPVEEGEDDAFVAGPFNHG